MWRDKRTERASDDDDLGAIESLTFDGKKYDLAGRFGRVSLRAAALDVDVW